MSNSHDPVIRPTTFGEYLRAVREAEGMAQREIAVMINSDQATVSRWERDISEPTEGQRAELIALLPALASAPLPGRPRARAVFNARQAGRARAVVAQQSAPKPAVSTSVLAFSVAVVRFVDSASANAGRADVSTVVALLKRGSEAGLTASEIASALETGGAS